MKSYDWHDSYFRFVMQYPLVVSQFLNWFAPKDIIAKIDLSKVKMLETSYIDKALRKNFSDIVFECPYKTNTNHNTKGGTKDNTRDSAKIIILIEHQSSPERFLPIRVHHYMASVLTKLIKENNNTNQLPAVYPMVYYNCHAKAYPFSTKYRDCVYGPKSAIDHYSNQPIEVININKLSSKQIQSHQLAGVITHAMKRTSKTKTTQNYSAVLNQLAKIESHTGLPAGFTESTIRYMMNVKKVDNLDVLIKQSQHLPSNVRGEAMTIAEAFEQRGKIEGKIEGKTEVAINLLNRNASVDEVVDITGLEISIVEQLKQKINGRLNKTTH